MTMGKGSEAFVRDAVIAAVVAISNAAQLELTDALEKKFGGK